MRATYKCTRCHQETSLTINENSIDHLGKCIVTANCDGMLVQTKSNKNMLSYQHYNNIKRKLYTEEIKLPRLTWYIRHNLKCMPVVYVEAAEQPELERKRTEDYTIKIVSPDEIELTFKTRQCGNIQCVARNTNDDVTVINNNEQVISEEYIQITQGGLLHLATPTTEESFAFLATYISANDKIEMLYNAIRIGGRLGSPFGNLNKVKWLQQEFDIRSVNIIDDSSQPLLFRTNNIVNGSVVSLSNYPSNFRILLTKSPHQSRVDIDKTVMVSVGKFARNDPAAMYYKDGELFLKRTFLQPISPPYSVHS